MKKKIIYITISVLILFGTCFSVVQANGGAAEIQRSVCSGGGGTASGGNVTLSGTLGQPLVGTSTEGSTTLSAGFWSGLETLTQFICYLPLVSK